MLPLPTAHLPPQLTTFLSQRDPQAARKLHQLPALRRQQDLPAVTQPPPPTSSSRPSLRRCRLGLLLRLTVPLGQLGLQSATSSWQGSAISQLHNATSGRHFWWSHSCSQLASSLHGCSDLCHTCSVDSHLLPVLLRCCKSRPPQLWHASSCSNKAASTCCLCWSCSQTGSNHSPSLLTSGEPSMASEAVGIRHGSQLSRLPLLVSDEGPAGWTSQGFFPPLYLGVCFSPLLSF